MVYYYYFIIIIIWSHLFVGIHFVNNGTTRVSFEMVCTKKIYYQNDFDRSLTEFIALQRLYNNLDMIQSMNGIVYLMQFVMF